MATKSFYDVDIVRMLRNKQGDKTGIEFAAEIGISSATLSYIYAGIRPPNSKVLDFLGLTEVTIYRMKV